MHHGLDWYMGDDELEWVNMKPVIVNEKESTLSDDEKSDISDGLDELAYTLAMDEALLERDIDKAREIYNLYNNIK